MKFKRKSLIMIKIPPEFNKLTANYFAARLAQANLVIMTDFDNKPTNLNKKVISNKTKHMLVKSEIKNQKHWIQSIFVVKVILKMIVLKIVQYFRQDLNILKGLVILMIMYDHGNQKDW